MAMERSPSQVRVDRVALNALKEKLQGNPDLELAARRMEQVELLLEGVSELYAAVGESQRAAAEAKVASMRQDLRAAAADDEVNR